MSMEGGCKHPGYATIEHVVLNISVWFKCRTDLVDAFYWLGMEQSHSTEHTCSVDESS